MKIPDCKKFNGYKPCKPYTNCLENGCSDPNPFGDKILIINLDAMGDVIMTTAQLRSIKRKYPESTIYWITMKVSLPLLLNNPLIDFPLEWSFDNIIFLQNLRFKVIFNADKSKISSSLMNILNSDEKYGFDLNENGIIKPVNEYAYYNYELGINDELKFKVNQKSGQEILSETFNLPFSRDKYILELTEDELKISESYRNSLKPRQNDLIIGFNTGCSNLFPNKKLTVEQHIELINSLYREEYKLVLLGGPEDTIRNNQIKESCGEKVSLSPTTTGLRNGLAYINACDLIITGDSFGMHASIGLGKHVIVWFGLSCWTEIDLYDNGVKIFNKDLECSPCWKKVCPNNLECITQLNLNQIIESVNNFYKIFINNR